MPRGSISHWNNLQNSGKCYTYDCCFTVRADKHKFWKGPRTRASTPSPPGDRCITSWHIGVFTMQEVALSLNVQHFYQGLEFYWVDVKWLKAPTLSITRLVSMVWPHPDSSL